MDRSFFKDPGPPTSGGGIGRIDSGDFSAPGGIGPHEGRELELMSAGRKPLAMFDDGLPPSYEMPESNFAPHVASGRMVRWESIYVLPNGGPPIRFVYFALAAEAWRIDAMEKINARLFAGGGIATDADEREIGKLLGYSEAEIATFLAWRDKPKAGR